MPKDSGSGKKPLLLPSWAVLIFPMIPRYIRAFSQKNKLKHLGLRIDSELHYKLHYLASYEGRSVNGEVVYLIRKAVKQFEGENGIIELPKEDE